MDVFPSSILKLTQVTSVDLSFNKIEKLPKGISAMTQLKHLYLVENALKKLPKQLTNLTNLETLALTGNKFVAVPKEIYSLVNLEILWLSYNQIEYLPGKLFKSLPKLKKFSCGFSLISMIPPEIKYCKNLEKMVIKCSWLKFLPIEMKNISIQCIEFYDNPLYTKNSLTPVNLPLEEKKDKNENEKEQNMDGLGNNNENREVENKPSNSTLTSVPSLFELCARQIKRIKEENVDKVPEYIREKMKTFKRCNVCNGPYFDHFHPILSFEHVSEVDDTITPILHNACSMNCLISLKDKYEEIYHLPTNVEN